jgi:hypothetical protein
MTGKNPEKLTLPVSVNPQGESRPWIKLWIGPWLDGTTRYEMSGSQRAFWVDLLAQAGRSRFPGVISPGESNGKILGYPLAWYQALQADIDVWATLQLFQSTGKINLTVTSEEPKCVAVEITNWRKYQPPLNGTERSRKSREKRKKGV